ncbi:the histone deposition protein Asf1 [Neoconidiobolus thromboides FSU 785]|nr:the histone deposition protein Asf1 [Neoconidiobolus thromboides FSU 785]
MSVVNILNISILNNPAPFLAPFQIEITFECIGQLQQDLEFNLYFVGHSTNKEWDQELDSLLVGPVPVGVNKFVMETKGPDTNKLNPDDVLDYTAIYLKCQYRDREFLRCSYLIKAEYNVQELQINPPQNIAYEHLVRLVSDKPKVTRFPIPW